MTFHDTLHTNTPPAVPKALGGVEGEGGATVRGRLSR